jgi:two-component system response regulator MtrA
MDGFRVLRTIRDQRLTVPVLILSAKAEETDKVYGFRVGADDYVTKPFGLSELIARVAALIRRGAGGDRSAPTIYRFSSVEVNATARTVTKDGRAVALTPKELDLLLAFLGRPGAVRSRIDLLREVWGHAPDVHTRTVDIHVGELRRKLEDQPSTPRHFATVFKAGYRFDQ